jgi:UDP-sugar transporter A1/2/3
MASRLQRAFLLLSVTACACNNAAHIPASSIVAGAPKPTKADHQKNHTRTGSHSHHHASPAKLQALPALTQEAKGSSGSRDSSGSSDSTLPPSQSGGSDSSGSGGPSPTSPSARSIPKGGVLPIVACVVLCAGIYLRGSLVRMAAGDVETSSARHMSLQVSSFLALVTLQTTAILLFKLCQVHGAYTFSPASSIAMTEALKFVIASVLHTRHVGGTGEPWGRGISRAIVLNYAGLSLLYTINNYITFEVHTIADPGSYTLGKSVTPYLVALMLRALGDKLHALQWVCIILQCGCLIVAQYDPCKGVGAIPGRAYLLIAISTCITATCGVWNQKVIKGFDVPVNLQNLVMYFFGFLLASLAFATGGGGGTAAAVGDEGAHMSAPGFFEGYTLLGVALMLSQALQGIAVSWVLKYADAIVKNFAGSAVMAILVVLSTFWFGLHTTLLTWVGVCMVLVITWCYMMIATKMPKE